MSYRIKKIFKLIGIFFLTILLLITILVFWLNSLGSTDDFKIKGYEANTFVDPMNNMLNIYSDLTLQAIRKKDKVSFILGLAVNVDVKEVIDLPNGNRLSCSMRSIILPMIGEWPKLNILTVQLPEDVHPSEQTTIRIYYCLYPVEKRRRFFKGISITENEVDVSGKSASFPFLMFSPHDFLGMMSGNMGVFRYFPYELKVDIPHDWKATLYYGMGTVKAVEKQKKRNIYHLSCEGGVALPIPAFQARKIIDKDTYSVEITDFWCINQGFIDRLEITLEEDMRFVDYQFIPKESKIPDYFDERKIMWENSDSGAPEKIYLVFSIQNGQK